MSGLVDRTLTFSYQDLLGLRQVEAWITLGCVGNEVGGDLVGTPLCQGVLLADLLRAAPRAARGGAARRALRRRLHRRVPGRLALDGRDALLALGMNARVLPPEHGFPVRLVVPGLYGYESAVRWLSEIQLADDGYRPYRVRRGYAHLQQHPQQHLRPARRSCLAPTVAVRAPAGQRRDSTCQDGRSRGGQAGGENVQCQGSRGTSST